MKQSYAEQDRAKREQILHDAEVLLMQDQPVTPLMNDAALWLVSSKVKGFVDNAVNFHLTRQMSIE